MSSMFRHKIGAPLKNMLYSTTIKSFYLVAFNVYGLCLLDNSEVEWDESEQKFRLSRFISLMIS